MNIVHNVFVIILGILAWLFVSEIISFLLIKTAGDPGCDSDQARALRFAVLISPAGIGLLLCAYLLMKMSKTQALITGRDVSNNPADYL